MEKNGEKRKREGDALDEDPRKKTGEEKMEKRKRDGDALEEDPRKKRRIAPISIGSEEEPSAGTSTATRPRTRARLTIRGFRFHQVLGQGGYGQVVLASVRRRSVFKAIKVVKKTVSNEYITVDITETIQRERRLLLIARDCPFLCHLNATLQTKERCYFVMDYLPGGSLESLIDVSGKLSRPTIQFFTAELICGLQSLHGRGIVHRDLKPDNIMLDKDGHIVIIDLGVAQDGLTKTSKICGKQGTPRYMAPEMILQQAYNFAVDWWSMGIVVFKMATGHSPFPVGPQLQIIEKSITTDEPSFPPWLDEDLKHLIQKLLQKDPERRLGMSGDIRSHPFFGDLDWEELEQRRIVPPFKPFLPVVGTGRLDLPEVAPALHPVSDFSFLAPSWTQ